MKPIMIIVAAVLGGFVGGIAGAGIFHIHERSQSERLLRARSFELVDETGQVISYWGVDKSENAVLAFGDHWPKTPNGTGGLSNQIAQRLDDPDNQRAAIGVIDANPFLRLRGTDGKTRVRLYLNDYAKPVLLMEDESGPRVSLGIEQSDTPGPGDGDWTLDFGPDSRARIGMYSEKDGGQSYLRGVFDVKKEKAKFSYRQVK